MLVEDDLTMLSLMSSLLEFEGYQVVKLDGNGKPEALIDAIRRECPDLVIIDVHLRHASGFDLLRRVRGDEGLKSVRVLMSSGAELSSRCMDEGADGFIMKPYMPDDLFGKIRAHANIYLVMVLGPLFSKVWDRLDRLPAVLLFAHDIFLIAIVWAGLRCSGSFGISAIRSRSIRCSYFPRTGPIVRTVYAFPRARRCSRWCPVIPAAGVVW